MAGVTAAMQKGPIDTATGLVVEETGYLHLLATKPDTVGELSSGHPRRGLGISRSTSGKKTRCLLLASRHKYWTLAYLLN